MSNAIILSCRRKVTIFIGTKRHEASWIKVSRGPCDQYLDAIHVEFKPKGARSLRGFVEDRRPWTVVLEGWGHPEFDELLRAIAEAPEVELSPGVSYRTVSQTIRPGQPLEKDKYELEFEDYVAKIDPARKLLDTRGTTVNRKF